MFLKRYRRAAATISALLCLWRPAAGQGMYGFGAGPGKATLAGSYVTPAVTGYYLHKLSRTFYLGAAVNYERYSFLHKYNPVSPAYGDVISIRQKSSYVLLSPKLDVGIGYRKYWHAYVSFGAGLLLGGSQVSNTYDNYRTTPPAYLANDTTAYNTSANQTTLVSRYTAGVSRRISLGGFWNVMLSAEYSMIPTSLTTHGPALRTNYFAFTVGLMHKYPMVLVEY